MIKCLLCDVTLSIRMTFTEIISMKKTQHTLCQECENLFEKVEGEICPSCSKMDYTSHCSDCQDWQRKGYEIQHTSLYKYNQAMSDYFSKYKFQGDYLLRRAFAKEIQTALANTNGYTIVPIPISDERKKERGFKQVEGLLDAAQIPYKNLIGKVHAQKQSEKNRQERLKTEQAFYLLKNVQIPKKIILVDDIYTTGTTLIHAREILMKNGAKEIKTFSLAR